MKEETRGVGFVWNTLSAQTAVYIKLFMFILAIKHQNSCKSPFILACLCLLCNIFSRGNFLKAIVREKKQEDEQISLIKETAISVV